MKFYLSVHSKLIITEGIDHAYVARTQDVLAELVMSHGFRARDYIEDAIAYLKGDDFFLFHSAGGWADVNQSNLNIFAKQSSEYADAITQAIIRHAI